MRKVNFTEALRMPLAHDICEIKGQEIKRAAFKRGHIITEEDENYLLELGKQHFYVLEEGDENLIHEEDAAMHMYKHFANDDFKPSPISMGKISFIANTEGFFRVNKQLLTDLNMLGEISAACKPDFKYVKAGSEVASMRIIPLFTTTDKLDEISKLANNLFSISKINVNNISLITTGSEVASGKIEDGFKPKLDQILSSFNLTIQDYTVVTDDKKLITAKIIDSLEKNPDVILVTGGMSVDPDDLTPGAIKGSGANIITYGTPIIPGSMLLYGLINGIPIMGLPGAVIFEQKTAFDMLLPYALTNTPITKSEIMEMCVGGMLGD